MTENEEFGFDGAEFDQRDYERKTFSEGYNTLNTYESKMYGLPKAKDRRNFVRRFIAQARTLANMILRYAEDEEIQEDALKLRDHSKKELRNMSKMSSYTPDTEILDSYRDILEDLRFNANFKIPETKKQDPKTAGVNQL